VFLATLFLDLAGSILWSNLKCGVILSILHTSYVIIGHEPSFLACEWLKLHSFEETCQRFYLASINTKSFNLVNPLFIEMNMLRFNAVCFILVFYCFVKFSFVCSYERKRQFEVLFDPQVSLCGSKF